MKLLDVNVALDKYQKVRFYWIPIMQVYTPQTLPSIRELTKILKAGTPSIFLGGSIDGGAAHNWQKDFIEYFKDYDVILLNPRRDDWDSSWKTDPIIGTPFYEQVTWELVGQENSTFNIYNFQEGSKSPITLMECGIFHDKSLVRCPIQYEKYGNVKIVCKRYGVPIYKIFDAFLDAVKEKLQNG